MINNIILMLILLLCSLSWCADYVASSIISFNYEEISSLRGASSISLMKSTMSNIVTLGVPFTNTSKVVVCNYSIPESFTCSSFAIEANTVIGVINGEWGYTSRLSTYELNSMRMAQLPSTEIYSSLIQTLCKYIYLAIGNTIAILNFDSGKFTKITEYYYDHSNVTAFSRYGPLIYSIRNDSVLAVYDYSESKYVHMHTIESGKLYSSIILSCNDNIVILINKNGGDVYLKSILGYTYIGNLEANICGIEQYSNNLFIANICDKNQLIMFEVDSTITEICKFTINSTAHSIDMNYPFLTVMHSLGINVYKITRNTNQSFFMLRISFLAPVGTVLLIMSITVLVVCLKIKRGQARAIALNSIIQKDKPVNSESTLHHLLACPISKQLMIYPVILMDGVTYEKSFADEWLRNNKISPVTQQLLDNATQIPNIPLQKFIQDIAFKIP